LVDGGIFEDTGRKFGAGQRAQVGFHHGAQVGVGLRGEERLIGKTDFRPAAMDRTSGRDAFAAEEKRSVRAPGSRRDGAGLARELALNPPGLAFGKATRFGQGTGARHCHPSRPIAVHAQHVTAGADVAHESQRNKSSAHGQRFPRLGNRASRWTKQLELHGRSGREQTRFGNGKGGGENEE
jgi:hypothetical protein